MRSSKKNARELMAIYLVYLYLLHAQSFTRFQALLRNKEDLSFHSQRTCLIPRESLLKLHTSLHFTCPLSFHDYASHSGPFSTRVSAASSILEAD